MQAVIRTVAIAVVKDAFFLIFEKNASLINTVIPEDSILAVCIDCPMKSTQRFHVDEGKWFWFFGFFGFCFLFIFV